MSYFSEAIHSNRHLTKYRNFLLVLLLNGIMIKPIKLHLRQNFVKHDTTFSSLNYTLRQGRKFSGRRFSHKLYIALYQ